MPGRSNVFPSGPVTALAIDPFGQVAEENRIATRSLVPGGYSWKSIVAKHTLVSDEAPGPRMIGIGTWRHRPRSGVRLGVCVRIPAQRQFDESAGGRTMHIRSRMVARTHDVIDLQLFDIRLFSPKTDLPASLKVLSFPSNHHVVCIVAGMLDFFDVCIMFYRVR